jgi:uncharacterized protein affecting Mg2+/Co2+ transport
VFLSLTIALHAHDTIHLAQKKWVFKKGRHHANHLAGERFVSKPEILRWCARFDTNSLYVLRDKNGKIDVDQYDWLKLHGMTFTPLRTMYNTAMVGWRYNVEKDSFELNAYFHQGGERFFNDKHIRVAVNEAFETEIRLDYRTKTITLSIITLRGILRESRSYPYKRFPSKVFLIHPFFGGTSAAPHKVSLFSELVKKGK